MENFILYFQTKLFIEINNLFLPRSPPRPRPENESKTREIGIATLKDIQLNFVQKGVLLKYFHC